MLRSITIILLACSITGCIDVASPKPRQEGGEIDSKGPTINLPAPQTVDTEKLEKNIKDQITASSNNTQNQLSGLVTASVSKLGEKVTGVEARVTDLIKVEATMNNTAQADLRAKVDSVITTQAEFRAEMNNMVEVSNKMSADLKAFADIKFQLGKITSDIEGQAGVNNKIEKKIEDVKQTFLSRAGRDVNMLPKQAVDIITNSWMFFAGLVSTLLAAATTIISLSYKYARQRAERRFELEKDSKEKLYELLHATLVELPPEKAEGIKSKMPKS
jgi:hypothetical protein